MNFNDGNIWVFYDGQCQFCRTWASRLMGVMRRHNIGLAPLQDEAVRMRVGLKPGEPLEEMKVLTRDGRIIGGLNCFIYLTKFIWWAYPLHVLLKIPGLHYLFNKIYQWFVRNRYCIGGTCLISADGAPKVIPRRGTP